MWRGFVIKNVKLPSSYTGTLVAVDMAGVSSVQNSFDPIVLSNVSSNGSTHQYLQAGPGYFVYGETTLVRTGGATDGGTAVSRKIVTSNDDTGSNMMRVGVCARPYPMSEKEDADFSAGTSKTLSLEILHDSVTGLSNKEMWIEVSVLDHAGSSLGSMVSSRLSDIIFGTPTTIPSSSATWTTTGMTNPNKQKISVTIAPQKKGMIFVELWAWKKNKTVYYCPKLDLA